MLNLNIVTTPKGDAAQFYSTLNAPPQRASGAAFQFLMWEWDQAWDRVGTQIFTLTD